MAVSDGECAERRSACRGQIYGAIHSRVTWLVAIIGAVAAAGGALLAIVYADSQSRASEADLRRVEARADETARTMVEVRESLAVHGADLAAIRAEQARAADRDERQEQKLDDLLARTRGR